MPKTNTSSVTGIINSADEATRAAVTLEEEGFARDSITVMSAEPLPAFMTEFESRSPGRAGLVAIAAGIAGAAAAITLTVFTAKRMGLVTGGMPIVTPWAFGIIVYELIALGAILATLATTIYEAGLITKSPAPAVDAAVADGKIAISVSCPSETSRRIAETVFSKFSAQVY